MSKPSDKKMSVGQMQRIDRIKAVAKELLGKLGAENMTMRDLAKASGVSHATLYNLFGTKDNIISGTVLDNYEERVRKLIDNAPEATSPLEKVRSSLDAIDHEIRRGPAFAQAMMSAYFKVEKNRDMPEALYRLICRTWQPILREMRNSGALRAWVSIPLVCESLSDQLFSITMKWVMHKVPRRRLGDHMRLAVFSILLGVSQGSQARLIEKSLAELSGKLESGMKKTTVEKPVGKRRG